MAKKRESPATGAVAAAEAVLTVAADNSTPAPEAATAASAAALDADRPRTVGDPSVEPDEVDEAAAGSWDEVMDLKAEAKLIDGTPVAEARVLTVTHERGIYLRIGPGKKFEPRRILPAGALVYPMFVPEYAQVPGWLCVAANLEAEDSGEPVFGWVDEALVAEAAE